MYTKGIKNELLFFLDLGNCEIHKYVLCLSFNVLQFFSTHDVRVSYKSFLDSMQAMKKEHSRHLMEININIQYFDYHEIIGFFYSLKNSQCALCDFQKIKFYSSIINLFQIDIFNRISGFHEFSIESLEGPPKTIKSEKSMYMIINMKIITTVKTTS